MCPSRLLADAPWAREFVDWWVTSLRFDGMSAAPHLTAWPFRGGVLRQPAPIVEAHKILTQEWARLQRNRKAEREPKAEDPKR